MGKKLEKRRPRPLLFPTENEDIPESTTTLAIGSVVTIGAPSNRYFQYIHHSLDFIHLTLTDLEKLLQVQGLRAVVTGFLKTRQWAAYRRAPGKSKTAKSLGIPKTVCP